MWHPFRAFIKYFWPEQESKTFLQKADKLLKAGNHSEAISFYQRALDASQPDFSKYSSIAFSYAMALRNEASNEEDSQIPDNRQKSLELFDKAFEAEKRAPSRIFPTLLLNYGLLSITAARDEGTTAPLDALIDKYHSLLKDVAEVDQPKFANAYHILGDALWARHDIGATSNPDQLSEAIKHLSRAVELSRDERSQSRSLQSLANMYNQRYESRPVGMRNSEDLTNAIEINTRAVEVLRKLNTKHADLLFTQHNLARQHFVKYLEQSKKKEDLDEAQRVAKEAKELATRIKEENPDLEQLLGVITATRSEIAR